MDEIGLKKHWKLNGEHYLNHIEARMTVTSISAITLSVTNMTRSVDFYRSTIGLNLLYGGTSDSFTSFQIGPGFLNLISNVNTEIHWWGRVILYVDQVDVLYKDILASGWPLEDQPRNAPWGERYFHVKDPDGHELSFATPTLRTE